MANNKDATPSVKGKPFNNDQDFLPGAEYYEALGQRSTEEGTPDSLELLIRREKSRIGKELLDEFKLWEYTLSERERKIKIKERELEIREADLNAREARLSRLEQFESMRSPKEVSQEAEDYVSDEEEILQQLEERDESMSGAPSKKPQRDYIPNPVGIGGLPGSTKSNAITIDRSQYQGDSITLENGNRLIWNEGAKEYEFSFIPGDDPKINSNRGLKFTYFAVEAAYLHEGYDNPNYSNFYSQTILRKQVWYESTPRNRLSDGIGEQYKGKVPLQVLIDLLNRSLNTRVFTSDGKFIENQDFRRAYKNWRLRYERGTYYKTSGGDLYQILEPGSQVSDSRGNPPVFRTDGNLRSPSYGQRVNLSTEERRKWKSGF